MSEAGSSNAAERSEYGEEQRRPRRGQGGERPTGGPALRREVERARHRLGPPAVGEAAEHESRGLPELVAKLAVAEHAQDVQVDVAPLRSVGEQAEAQRVRAALGDAAGELLGLRLLGLCDLARVEVAAVELGVQRLESDPADHLRASERKGGGEEG